MAGLTAQFRRLVRAALGLDPDDNLPVIDRLALYRAEVKATSQDGQLLDVQPEDPRIAGHQAVPVRVGVPGIVAVVQPDAVVLLGWERGDPGRPYCVPSWESGATVQKIVVNVTALYLGSESGTQPAVLGDALEQRLANLEAFAAGHTHTVAGGVAAPSTTPLPTPPNVRSNTVRLKP